MSQEKTELEKTIDKLIKRHKENETLPQKQDGKNKIIDRYAFLTNLLSTEQSGPFPSSEKNCEALMILSSSLYTKKGIYSYEKSFKYFCDIDHPIIKNVPKILKLSENEFNDLLFLIKAFNGNYLDYYNLFKNPKEDTDVSVFSVKNITKEIDSISTKSTYGTIVSHPAKMTYPGLKFPKIFYTQTHTDKDGYIKTGSSEPKFDLHIDAKYLKVYKFLSLPIENQPIFNFLQKKDEHKISSYLGVPRSNAKEWIKKFSKCLTSQNHNTSDRAKQVFFPVGGSYHQLSVLKPSGLVFSLKDKIDAMNGKSPKSFLGRKAYKENAFFEKGFSALLNLTVTKHGGDHPKNISALNNKYQTYYLLDSSPPHLDKRKINFPKKNFFANSIWYRDIREPLKKLHGIFKTGLNSEIPRRNLESGRDHRIEEILDIIIERSAVLRSVAEDQYREESSALPDHQKIWLCHGFAQVRKEQGEWLDTLCAELAKWIATAYAKMIKKPVMLGPVERDYLKTFITLNREALR
nr:type I-F CRISPR-associated protein Csy1 [uncultured Desulfobacter sp.]